MSISIGDGLLPPVYPSQPTDTGSGDGESSGSTGTSSSGDGGPDAVYEPGAPEEGEPLTYSFPQGTTSSSTGEDDAGADAAESAGDGGLDPYADGASGDGVPDEGFGDANDGAVPGDNGSYDYSDYGDGSNDPAAEWASEDGAVDPEADIAQEDGKGEVGRVGDDTAPVPMAAQRVAQDHISAVAHQEAVAEAAAAAEAARPSLASALGQNHAHASLAVQIGKASSATDAATSASTQSVYIPRAMRTVRAPATQQAGKLLDVVQDAVPSAQAETPKVRTSVMAQAAYTMIGEARRLDRSMLSLIDKFG